MPAYYNEVEPFAAEWLRNLIAKGLIAPGDVDTRSIMDVRPDDLKGYEQCHFFAGIGGWSHALRLAGWPDDRPVWTGSCPCQPFSAAGKGKAFDDERHLAPAWLSLIAECRPGIIFGEQVEAAIGWGWLDFVFDALEAEGYACGAAVLPAAGVGAPHIRNRLYFVAYTDSRRRSERSECYGNTPQPGKQAPLGDDADGCSVLGDPHDSRLEGRGLPDLAPGGGSDGQLAARETGSTRGFWRDADWIYCTDGKTRAVEPGTFPLAYGVPARVGRLRAFGNAIVPQVAEAFIRAYDMSA